MLLLLKLVLVPALVGAVTLAARQWGHRVGGLLTPFPVATAIIAAFTHAQRGPSGVIAFFRGFLLAENSFALFCAVFAATLGPLPLAFAVALALASQLGLQGIILWHMMRSRVSSSDFAVHPVPARVASGPPR